jgi:hypothetical protein
MAAVEFLLMIGGIHPIVHVVSDQVMHLGPSGGRPEPKYRTTPGVGQLAKKPLLSSFFNY